MDFAFQEEEQDDWSYFIDDDGDRRAVPRSVYVPLSFGDEHR